MWKWLTNVQMALKYKNVQMAVKYFYSMKILSNRDIYYLLKIFKELSNGLLDNLMVIILFYNI